jgi:alpha-tubulin suppressor-like RCC1 family protein
MTFAVAEEDAKPTVRRTPRALLMALFAVATLAFPAGAAAEPASEPSAPAAGQLDSGVLHTCAIDAGRVRCWGAGNSGQLGYGDAGAVGDDEVPGTAGPVDLGPGRSATAISAGDFHTCAVLDNGSVRCWGFGGDGRLGYGHQANVGDDETPGSLAPVDLGSGQSAVAISAGGAHTCAILNTGGVLCWGFGEDGRLGYGDPATIGDDEVPGSLVPVNLGPGRTATAITAGGQHTCALLDNAAVRCWGTNGTLFQGDGRLGYGTPDTIGNDETPAAVDPVNTGGPVTAISAGTVHTCAVLVGGSVRCWGNGTDGRNGYANEFRIGDNETPNLAGPVDLGGPAAAISVSDHSCARLVNGTVRCWGPGTFGRLGYANTNDIGDNEFPSAVDPVDLVGLASSVSAGGTHTCARLNDGALRCWGEGAHGRLGYANTATIGDDEPPSAAGPVDLKTRAVSIADTQAVEGSSGTTTMTFTVRLSAGSDEGASVAYTTVDDSAASPADFAAQSGRLTFAPGETSRSIAVQVAADALDEIDERLLLNLSNPVNLAIVDTQGLGTILDDDTATAPPADPLAEALRLQAQRLADLRACRRSAAFKRTQERSAARRRHRRGSQALARALRTIDRTAARRRSACLKEFGRTPGRVTSLVARRSNRTTIVLRFGAAGTDGSKLPAAEGYLVKQSRRPIRTTRDFNRASALCRGNCRFDVQRPGDPISLRVARLRRNTTYYYAVAARDNVSSRRGPRSKTVSVRTG